MSWLKNKCQKIPRHDRNKGKSYGTWSGIVIKVL